MADPIQLEFEFPDNTGPIASSWSSLAGITKDMRSSWDAINDAMTSTIDKADDLRTKLNLKDEVLSGIKTMLTEISSTIDANDSTLRSSLQTINQIMGNSNSVSLLMSRVDGYAPGGPQGFSNPLASPTSYAAYANQTRQQQSDPFNSPGAMSSQFSDYNQPSFFGKQSYITPREQDLGISNGFGGRGGGGTTRTSFGAFDDSEDPMNNTPFGTTGAGSSEYSNDIGTYGFSRHQAPRPVPGQISNKIPRNLMQPLLDARGGFSNQAQTALDNGNYNALTSTAIQGGMNQISQSALGVIPGMNSLLSQVGSILSNVANRKSGPNDTDFTQRQTAVLDKLSTTVERLTQSSTAMKAASYASSAAGAYNMIRGGQNLALSKISYPSQAIANMTGGQTQYMPWNGGNALNYKAQNFLYSMDPSHGFGMTYSPTDALTAQYAANQLGLKGGPATNYKNVDYTMQTQYGLSHGETQQLANTALAYGMNLNQYATGAGQARLYGNQVGNTQQQYTMGAYETGSATAASLGYNTQASVGMGKQAAAFGAGNQINQNAMMTGQELMGTTLGTALFAQQAGVSFMDAFAKAETLTSTQAKKYQSNAMIGLLQNLGIPVNNIKSIKDLYPYAIKLGIILPQLGVTNVSTPLQAINWAFTIIQQAQGLSGSSGTSNIALGTPGTGTQGVPANSTMLDSTNLTQSLNSAGFNATGLGAGGSSSATTSNGVTVQVNLAPGLQNIISATVQSSTAALTSPSARLNNPSGG